MYTITSRKDVCNPATYVGKPLPQSNKYPVYKITSKAGKPNSMPMKFRARNSVNELPVPATDRKRLSALEKPAFTIKALPTEQYVL
jgi:hypothetical protein